MSRYLVVAYFGAVCMMVLAFVLINAPAPYVLLALVFAFLALVLIFRQLSRLRRLDKIVIDDEGLSLIFDGVSVSVHISGNAVVSEHFIAWRCRPTEPRKGFWPRSIDVVLLPDSVSPNDHHFLRMMLVTRRLS